MPLIGYMYTGRYKALFKTFGIFFGILVLCFMAKPSLDEDEDFMTGMMFLYGAGTALENTRAVIHGKKRLKNQQIPALNPDKVKIQLLKVAKAQGAITVADCVLETGCSAAEVRQYLEELQQEDLIRVDNRESDGAIIYRII
jgi:predicted HTH transcriptional regulator